MQELEKILEEIDQEKKNAALSIRHTTGYKAGQIRMAERIEEIIRKYMNDGWISVQDKLPEDDVDVLIAYADIDDENYTDICITTYGYAYLGGNKLDFKEWRSPFEYFRSNYKVIAWQPLPEPYKLKQPETCKYTGGSCCWPIDQCSDCPNNPERGERE